MALVVLEYLKLFLSWPVVVGLIAVLCLCMFKQEVKSLMLRLASIKLKTSISSSMKRTSPSSMALLQGLWARGPGNDGYGSPEQGARKSAVELRR
ncbi:hypothetical protein LMG26685_01819 [Achromobacter mucicolens]|nr:hypothetical protein LMG26685_01819 [Achromobacter mucicolens]